MKSQEVNMHPNFHQTCEMKSQKVNMRNLYVRYALPTFEHKLLSNVYESMTHEEEPGRRTNKESNRPKEETILVLVVDSKHIK